MHLVLALAALMVFPALGWADIPPESFPDLDSGSPVPLVIAGAALLAGVALVVWLLSKQGASQERAVPGE